MEKMKKNIYDVALGSVLKDYRLQSKLSLQNVGDKMGLTKQMIHHYESGRSPLTVSQLIRLCNIYGIDYATVLKQVQIQMGKSQ